MSKGSCTGKVTQCTSCKERKHEEGDAVDVEAHIDDPEATAIAEPQVDEHDDTVDAEPPVDDMEEFAVATGILYASCGTCSRKAAGTGRGKP